MQLLLQGLRQGQPECEIYAIYFKWVMKCNSTIHYIHYVITQEQHSFDKTPYRTTQRWTFKIMVQEQQPCLHWW